MSSNPTSLEQCLDKARKCLAGSEIFAFVYTPASFRFGRVSSAGIVFLRGGRGQESEADEELITADKPYEVRLFNHAGELHWRRNDAGGTMVTRKPAEDEFQRTYLLWGNCKRTVEKPSGEWSCLVSTRVAPLWIPLRVVEGGRAALKAAEMVVSSVEADGNCGVAGERLTGLEAQP